MKKVVKFSKNYGDIFKLKSEFYDQNKKNLQKMIQLNRIYLKGPRRKKCKNCEKKISKFFLKTFSVKYSLCKFCGHLNGEKQETKSFFNTLYVSGPGSKNLEKNYAKSFNQRVKNIYNDKVLFLKSVFSLWRL